jgi:osmotically-inducible protein OsmY
VELAREKQDAERVARHVSGVSGVANRIRVRTLRESTV